MSVEVLLPQLGFTMNDGQLMEWLVADGANVTAGQTLYSLEAEKSIVEVEAPESGVLKIIAAAGQAYPVGTVLAVIE